MDPIATPLTLTAPILTATGFARFPIADPGDVVDSLTLYLVTTTLPLAAGVDAVEPVTVSMHASNQPAANAAIAARGELLLGAIDIPAEWHTVDPLVAATAQGVIRITVPMSFVVDNSHRHISITTVDDSVEWSGVAFLKMFRPRPIRSED